MEYGRAVNAQWLEQLKAIYVACVNRVVDRADAVLVINGFKLVKVQAHYASRLRDRLHPAPTSGPARLSTINQCNCDNDHNTHPRSEQSLDNREGAF